MDIREAVSNVFPYEENSSYQKLHDIMSTCELDITWWGSRRVYSTDPEKYTGHIPLYKLIDEAMWLVQRNLNYNHEVERPLGKELYKKLDQMYEKSHRYKTNSGLIKWLFQLIICGITHSIETYHCVRINRAWVMGDGEQTRFLFYNEVQYTQAFSEKPTGEGKSKPGYYTYEDLGELPPKGTPSSYRKEESPYWSPPKIENK